MEIQNNLSGAVLINEIKKIVEDTCRKDTNLFGFGIWTHHILPVTINAIKLTNIFGGDPEIVEIAGLLHDYASVKDAALYKEHHFHGKTEAEKILINFNYPAEKIEIVKYCIETHRGSVPMQRKIPEAECLANADAMTHIEQVPSLLQLAFIEKGMGIDAGTTWVQKKLERTWAKLHPEVKKMMQEKYSAAIIVLEQK